MGQIRKMQMGAGIILSYALIAVKLLTGLIYTPIILHSLGQAQYGIYNLIISFAGYLTIFDSGTNAAYVRFYVQAKGKDKQYASRLNSLFLGFYIFLAVCAAIIGAVLSFNAAFIFGTKILPEEYTLIKKCLLILSGSLFFEIINCFWNSVIIANEHFVFGKFVTLLSSILTPLLTVPLLLIGYDCSGIIHVRFAFAVLTFIAESIYCIKKISITFDFTRVERNVISSILQFVFFIVLQSVMDQINWQIDKLILSWTRGSAEISVYSIGTTFNTIYMTFPAAISGVFIAQANRLVAAQDNNKLMDLFIKTSRMCAYVVFAIITGYTFWGRKFIERWAGEGFDKSYVIGLLLMFPLTFSLVLGIGQDITRAKNKHKWQILLDFFVCIVNLIVSIPLAMKWGAIGSAFGTFLSEIILCCVIQPIYYQRIVGIDMKKTFFSLVPILKCCIIPCIYGLAVNYFELITASYISIMIHGTVFIILYCLSAYFFCFNKQEKQIVYDIFSKMRIILAPKQ